jgi:prepilin-type N-terminal cleavage/methylation domain-containing protein
MIRPVRHGFTLVELLVVIAIIGVLVSLLLPAVQATREVARRSQCMSNIRQLIIALHSYEFAHEHFPAGVTNETGPVRNVPEGNHLSWIAQILPELEEGARYHNLDATKGAYHQRNNLVRQSIVPLLICPSDSTPLSPVSNYAGVHHHKEAPIDADNKGVLFLNSRITFDEIVDGSSYTIAVGEKLINGPEDLGWMSGTAATLRNPDKGVFIGGPPAGGGPLAWDTPPPWYDRPEDREAGQGDANPFITVGGNPQTPLAVRGFGTYHPGYALFAFADGSVRGLSPPPSIFWKLANRKDRTIIEEPW